MKTIDKQAILDVLNSIEVIEQNGGENAYILVENNAANHEKLNAVGVPSEAINKYGDEVTFCILALAFCEGYANDLEYSKLIVKMKKYLVIWESEEKEFDDIQVAFSFADDISREKSVNSYIWPVINGVMGDAPISGTEFR